ncbi:putative lipoprotein YbbD precursor [Posidoniimonas polymericola]|uniref:beta-N-acetylhexosaminidase n=1 Tax=Posidoniimonas polymericola TaxID=2528002 RepID=A0A5C5YUV6_9BACT|nr:glycoside hydrolase family 3 N-terminal domain-containing protein [Posidoniimonas polymericola]TWT78433.1 putative lipoprotein YbbD precursor [Posidoniimonas polymericola]
MTTTVEQLSLEEKIAQLVFVRMGSNLPPIVTASDDEERVAALLEDCPVGGLLLFNGVWPEVRASLGRLQAKVKTPLLVSADLERGAGQQLAGLTVFPHARAFAELGEQTQADLRRAIEITAEEALQAGVQILFAPVADANTNPKNPIIATRAYGEEPAAVAELVATVVDAMNSAGALAAAKHFPGHGDTSQDSHAELPSVDHPAEVLHRQELVPFRAAIAAGVPLIMSAHVCYPALDPSGEPATFSKAILTDLLRGELGFEGAVCSDSLLMAGATGRYESEAEMAAAALTAGVDLLLDLAHPVATVREMSAMVERGDLPLERVDEALGRVMRLKERVAGVTPFSPEIGAEQRDANRVFAAAAAEGAIRIFGDGPPPTLDPKKSTTVVLTKPFNLPTDPAKQPLADAIGQLLPGAQYFEFGPEIDQVAADAAVAAAADSDQVLLAVIAKPAAWHAFGMTDDQRRLAERLAADTKTIVASLGVPTILADFPADRPKLCTFSDVPASQQALARKLCGGA